MDLVESKESIPNHGEICFSHVRYMFPGSGELMIFSFCCFDGVVISARGIRSPLPTSKLIAKQFARGSIQTLRSGQS